jgi:3-oxoacyl-[acyl-carrier protein] reductase
MDWEGATAVVTGASRGIGAQVARLAVQRGARVGLIARSRSDLDELAAELGPEVVVAPADVSVPAQLEAALAEVRARLGPIDILVNNAGAGGYGPFLSSAADEAERLMQINYLAAVTATRWVLPEMLAARCGHIVTVGSISGRTHRVAVTAAR